MHTKMIFFSFEKDLRKAGYSVSDLIDADILPETLKKYGFSASDFRKSNKDIKVVYSAGFSVKELLHSGYSIEDILYIGVPLKQLRKVGVSCDDLRKCGISLKEMKKAGYTIADMQERGEIPIQQLKKAGFTVNSQAQISSVASTVYSSSPFCMLRLIFVLKKIGTNTCRMVELFASHVSLCFGIFTVV